jgi:chemotaxis signal transduction protein
MNSTPNSASQHSDSTLGATLTVDMSSESIDLRKVELSEATLALHQRRLQVRRITETVELTPMLSFRLAEQWYLIEVDDLEEVVRLEKLAFLPHLPPWVLGCMNYRSHMTLVGDLSLFLGMEKVRVEQQSSRVLIHGKDDVRTGLLVDEVGVSLAINKNKLRYHKSKTNGWVNASLKENERRFSFIDVHKLLKTLTNQHF